MSKKIKSEKQLLYEKRAKEIDSFGQPLDASKKFIKITHYMLQHENFKNLSSSAKVALLYMLDWAFGNNEFLETGIFEFSTTMLSNNNIMSRITAMAALKELENAKFIQKENNACAHSGITQKWSFTNRWYTGSNRSQ